VWAYRASESKSVPAHRASRLAWIDISQVLAQGLPPAVTTSYRALADHSEVPRSTLHARAQGRRSIEEKAQSQQYLSLWEEDALVKFLLQMSDLGQPVRIKFIPFLAFCVACQRSEQA
jgi:hypothetical protein